MIGMVICGLCPDGDNTFPMEMMKEHMQILHPDHAGEADMRVMEMHLSAPPNTTPEMARAMTEAVAQVMKPLIAQIQYLEEKCSQAFTAGFRDGHETAVDMVAELTGGTSPLPIEGVLEFLRAKAADEIPYVVSPADVVSVLMQDHPIDLSSLEFAVATVIAPESFDGRAQKMVPKPSWYPFAEGEIVLVDDSGREPFGEQRHVRKWGVTFEYAKTLPGARLIRDRVKGVQE